MAESRYEGTVLFKSTKGTPEGHYLNACGRCFAGWWCCQQSLPHLGLLAHTKATERSQLNPQITGAEQRWWKPGDLCCLGAIGAWMLCGEGSNFAPCWSQPPRRHLHSFQWLVQLLSEHPVMDVCLRKPLLYHLPSLCRWAVLAQRWMRITKVDEDDKGERCLLALPWERALWDGSIVPGSPWLLAIQVPRELNMMSGFGEKV